MLRSLGLGLGLETFAKFLRVSVSVSKNLVSEKKSRFRFRKNLVSEKSLGFGFGKFGIVKKVSVSVSVKILVSSFSDRNVCSFFISAEPGSIMVFPCLFVQNVEAKVMFSF